MCSLARRILFLPSRGTCTGEAFLTLLPSPSWPSWFRHQAQHSPPSNDAKLWRSPAATPISDTVTSILKFFGIQIGQDVARPNAKVP